MLIKFKSQAQGAADVLMFGEVALPLLEIMGKRKEERGIVTVEQMPEAIARIEAAIAASKRSARASPSDVDEDADRPSVSLAQRALPLLGLLQHALREREPVTWAR